MKKKVIILGIVSLIILTFVNSVQAAVYIESVKSNTKANSSLNTSSSKGLNVTNNISTTTTKLNDVNTSSTLRLISLEIEDEKIKLEPKFNSETYEYVVNVEGDIDSLPIKIISNQQDATEKIIGNEDLQDGESEILIKLTSQNKKEEIEYKITVRKNIKEPEVEEVELTENKYYSEEHVQYGWFIVGAVLGTFTLILIIMIIIGKKKRKKRK